MKASFHTTVVALVGGSFFACSAPESVRENDLISVTAQAYTTNADLVSPSACTLSSGRLLSCAIATRTLDGLPMTSTAVPLRTTVTAVKSGNCSTQYPLELALSADGADSVTFQYISGGSTTIRRHDGQPIPRVTVTDTSPWTRFANFDSSCRIGLSIVSNEPDVNSKADAQEIIAALTADVVAKTAIRDRYQQLSLYHRAFQFSQSVANNFLVELTNESIQQLRSLANDASAAIASLMSSCGDTSITDGDRQNLLLLYMSLPALGHRSDWQTNAGEPKTLADFLGPSQAEVLATVQKLANHGDQNGGSTYDVDYQTAVRDVVVAQEKLDQAQAQLANWLAP